MTHPHPPAQSPEDAASDSAGAGAPSRGPEWALRRLEDAATLASVAAVTGIMLVVVLDVFMRYVFNSPLAWAHEFVSNYLVPVAVFFVLAQTMRHGEHIAVDFLVQSVSPRVRRVLHRIAMLASLAIVCVLAWVVGAEALRSFIANEYSLGNYVWPIWLSKLIVPLGVGLLVLRLVVLAFGRARDA